MRLPPDYRVRLQPAVGQEFVHTYFRMRLTEYSHLISRWQCAGPVN